jgi:GxxExxY protein
MIMELRSMGIRVQSQVSLPVFYRGKKVKGEEFEIDLLVENELLVQILALERVLEFHKRQILMYLQVARKPLGLLINFGERVLVTSFEGGSALNPRHPNGQKRPRPELMGLPSDSDPLKEGRIVKEMTKNVHEDFR